MSLFDVIKYPISDPPRASEIDALPVKIHYDWIRRMGYEHIDHPYTVVGLLRFMFDNKQYAPKYAISVNALREIIKNYEEPV